MKAQMVDVPVDSFMVHTADDLQNVWPWLSRLKSFLNFDNGAVYVICYRMADDIDQRSGQQNALYWAWMQALANHFNVKAKRGKKFTKDDIHDLMRHKFLGYVDRKIHNTELKPVLRSTATLQKNDMTEYLYQIDNWAQEVGCLLPYPGSGDYAKYKEARQ